MARQLYYRDSYGRVHRDRAVERRHSGGSTVAGGWFLKVLLILAAVVVLASFV